MKELQEILDSINSYVKIYIIIRVKVNDGESQSIRLRILRKRVGDGRRYNFPTLSEVVVLIVGDFDAFDCERDVVVEERSGLLKRISIFEPSYFPLQYPLLLPTGEDGFRNSIEYIVTDIKTAIKRKYVTHLEWVGYRIQHRERHRSTIVFSKIQF